jgi:hypothetical protein
MLNGKYISIKEIIDSVYRDTGFKEELTWEDLIYWVSDALDLIGMPGQYVKKVTGSVENPNLKIKNYRAKLPCDFHKLIQMSVNGYTVLNTTDTFHYLMNGDCCDIDTNDSKNLDIYKDNFNNTFSPNSKDLQKSNYSSKITYDINNEYITLSVKEGDLCISYLAFPVDEEGYPLIPDDIKYKQAVKYYLMSKIFYRMWINDDIKKDKYEDAEKNWLWYVGAAQNSASMPNIDKMESLKNQMIRLIPKNDQHKTFFKSLASRERLKRR